MVDNNCHVKMIQGNRENGRGEKENACFYIRASLSHQLYSGSLARRNKDDDKITECVEEPQKTQGGLKVL